MLARWKRKVGASLSEKGAVRMYLHMQRRRRRRRRRRGKVESATVEAEEEGGGGGGRWKGVLEPSQPVRLTSSFQARRYTNVYLSVTSGTTMPSRKACLHPANACASRLHPPDPLPRALPVYTR